VIQLQLAVIKSLQLLFVTTIPYFVVGSYCDVLTRHRERPATTLKLLFVRLVEIQRRACADFFAERQVDPSSLYPHTNEVQTNLHLVCGMLRELALALPLALPPVATLSRSLQRGLSSPTSSSILDAIQSLLEKEPAPKIDVTMEPEFRPGVASVVEERSAKF
jgi:hypothetical protein